MSSLSTTHNMCMFEILFRATEKIGIIIVKTKLNRTIKVCEYTLESFNMHVFESALSN